MKKIMFLGIVAFFAATILTSFNAEMKNTTSNKGQANTEASNRRISFKIRGTGSKGISVKIGIGPKIGMGSCCSTISPNTSGHFSGEEGYIVYDSERKRVITKIYSGLEGTTIELKDYY